MDDKQTIYEHLGELRKRIIMTLIVFFLAMVIGFIISIPLVEYLKNDPVAKDIPWNVFKINDAFRVYVQFSLILSSILTIPFLMYQIFAFVRPGLTKKERKTSFLFIPIAALLFITGVLFGYYVLLPLILTFMGNITRALGANEMYGIAEYFGFVFRVVFPVSLVFQLPVIIMFLTQLGIIKPSLLKKARKIAYLTLTILSAVVTPPDFISQLLVLIPLAILYEASIWISNVIYRKKKAAKDKVWNEENTEETQEA